MSYFFKKIGEKIAQNTINPINRFLFKTIPQVFADSSVFNISGDNKSFILFADIPCNLGSGQKGNLQYDYPSSRQATPCGRLISPTEVPVCDPALVSNGVECLSVTNLVGPDKIAGFCLNQECDNFINGTSTNLRPGSLDFVFTRPNPDAAFCYTAPNAVNCTESVGVSHAGVVVQSTVDSRTKTIVVWSTGQISVY